MRFISGNFVIEYGVIKKDGKFFAVAHIFGQSAREHDKPFDSFEEARKFNELSCMEVQKKFQDNNVSYSIAYPS